jgi:membrane-associated protease RseP (regulator of RpoE activity)
MMRTMTNATMVAGMFTLLAATSGWGQQQCAAGTARPSLGIRTFHCQGGTCMVDGTSATMDESVPAQARAMREASPSAYWFSVEPRLYGISGFAQSLVQDGDILAAVNGAPITTRAAGMHLAGMQPGTPVRLTLRRDGILLEGDVVAETSCAPVRASAGPEAAPAGTVTLPLGVGGGRGGRGAGRGSVFTTRTVPIYVRDGNVVRQQDVTVAVRDSTIAVRTPLRVVDGVIVTTSSAVAGRGGRGGGRGGRASTAAPGRVRVEASGLVLAGEKEMNVDPNGAVRWWFTTVPSVVEVVAGSAAARAGIAVGDVIQTANNRAVTTAEGVAALVSARAGNPVMISVRRGNSILNLELFGGE